MAQMRYAERCKAPVPKTEAPRCHFHGLSSRETCSLQVEMQQQGKGTVQDTPIEQLASLVEKSQLMVVHLAAPSTTLTSDAARHLQRLATRHLGTAFVQADLATEQEEELARSQWGVG